MLKGIIKVLMIFILVGFLVYGGMCVYANFFAGAPGEVDLPSENKAQYIVTIEANGRQLFTDEYEQQGAVYILHGYYELVDEKYRYRDRDLRLDTSRFGNIQITSRG